MRKKLKLNIWTRIRRDTSRFARDHTRWSRATSSKVWMSKRGVFDRRFRVPRFSVTSYIRSSRKLIADNYNIIFILKFPVANSVSAEKINLLHS